MIFYFFAGRIMTRFFLFSIFQFGRALILGEDDGFYGVSQNLIEFHGNVGNWEGGRKVIESFCWSIQF